MKNYLVLVTTLIVVNLVPHASATNTDIHQLSRECAIMGARAIVGLTSDSQAEEFLPSLFERSLSEATAQDIFPDLLWTCRIKASQ